MHSDLDLLLFLCLGTLLAAVVLEAVYFVLHLATVSLFVSLLSYHTSWFASCDALSYSFCGLRSQRRFWTSDAWVAALFVPGDGLLSFMVYHPCLQPPINLVLLTVGTFALAPCKMALQRVAAVVTRSQDGKSMVPARTISAAIEEGRCFRLW